ncbi:MAG: class I SAM-dependent methyltransferase [Chloroflexi bacterium]|nr:class I SAM-dependent methyltransferase [Chloroflexota bacterium]
MSWVSAPFLIAAIGAVLYWLFILTEGVYLGNKVVIALYDWNASHYDQVKQVLPHEDGVHLARPLLAALQGIRSPLVLDVATGTGRLPVALLRQWDFQGRIVGLDLSQRMLAIAKHKTRAHGHRVGWVRDNAMTLPFPSDIFHAVTCIEALEFLPKPWEALAEMVRVLRPGGQLVVTNRVGIDAFFLPGRAYPPTVLEQRLRELGLANVKTRRWQIHYDLVDAQKPLEQYERKLL